ncbi:MAG: AgmX/PglI C-terminal domain-containing protein [Deltaproteobacteria bacterium]|nr:AgmX/PglI C-terminal domain-containing protein [Deltaproteobacteria bacterium]
MAASRATTPLPNSGGQRARILRIGVLLGGKIVEERLIRERIPVSIGQSMKNTFSIPVEGLPLEFTLFALDEGKYSLRFLPKMDGRLSDGSGQVNTLDALKQRGATNSGDYWQVPLGDSARGKLSLGDLTVLFQFVTEPPRQPKPMLPASVRGTFADRFDPRLTVIMSISIIAHFIFVIWALLGDPTLNGSMAQRAYNLSFKQEVIEAELAPEPEKVPVETGSDGSAAAKTPDKTPAKSNTPSKTPEKNPGGNDGGRNEADNVALQEAQARAAADALTAFGPNGTSEGDMSKRRPGADLGQQITDVKESGKQVSVGGGKGGGSRGNGDPRVGTGNGPKIDGPTGTESAGGGKTTESGPTGRITVGTKETFDDSTLTPDVVLQKIIAQYMTGIKRCYKEHLKKDATARGKVILDFTVNETGRLVNGKASNFADDVTSCIQTQMGSWRFPIPKKDGEPTEASFRIALQLIPD